MSCFLLNFQISPFPTPPPHQLFANDPKTPPYLLSSCGACFPRHSPYYPWFCSAFSLADPTRFAVSSFRTFTALILRPPNSIAAAASLEISPDCFWLALACLPLPRSCSRRNEPEHARSMFLIYQETQENTRPLFLNYRGISATRNQVLRHRSVHVLLY